MLQIESKKSGFVHSARELWAFYGSPGKFATWFDQLAKRYGFLEDRDFVLKVVQQKNSPARKEIFLSEASLRTIQIGHGKAKNKVQSVVAQETIKADELLQKISDPRFLAQKFLELAEAQEKLSVLCTSGLTLTAQEIAKDLGLESAKELNKRLVDLGYLYRDQRGRALPFANKVPKDCYEIRVVKMGTKVANSVLWTPEGKVWINSVLIF